MPEFISKVQYKTCEKGEYYDELPRTLEETIELINTFPWSREQYADIDLTGPSITIKDKRDNYLKVGIWYGGRYTLYYFDKKHNLYTKFNVKIETVYTYLTAFFNNQFDWQGFERSKFEVTNFQFFKKNFFVTNDFIYRPKLGEFILYNTFAELICLMPLAVFSISIFHRQTNWTPVIFLLMWSYFYYVLIYSFFKFRRKSTQYIKISRGNDLFSFGNDINDIKNYNKTDILEIKHYINKNYKHLNELTLIEIIFNDKTSITFTNMLISEGTLSSKFSPKWKLEIVKVPTYFVSLMRLIY
jgi:hypothetical protein